MKNLKFKMKLIKGQAILETFLVLIILIPVIFATIQLSIIAFGAIVSYDASQSACRAAIVQGQDTNANSKAKYAGLYVMSSQAYGTKNVIPLNVIVRKMIPAKKSIKDHDNRQIEAYDVTQKYGQLIMFPSLINPFHNLTFFSGGIPYAEGSANCRLVGIPDKGYMGKAYTNANKW